MVNAADFTSASNFLVLMPSRRWRLPEAHNPLSLRLAKVRVCGQDPHQLVAVSEDIFPPDRTEILRPPPNPTVLLAPLHPVHRAQPGDDPVKLVHEHAEREEHRSGGDHQRRSDEVRREGAVVVAVLLRDALDEVVQHEADGVGRYRQGVEQEQDEVLLIRPSYAIVHPRAVVVHAHHASPTETAVVCSVSYMTF